MYTLDDFDELTADICYRLFEQMEDALLSDKGNLYRLRRAFIYGPNANPVIIKAVNNITFGREIIEVGAESLTGVCTDNISSSDGMTLSMTFENHVWLDFYQCVHCIPSPNIKLHAATITFLT